MQWKKEKNDVREKTGSYETTYMFTNDSVVVEYQNVTDEKADINDLLQLERLVYKRICKPKPDFAVFKCLIRNKHFELPSEH